MNSVFILDIEVYYLTQFIFFVVSLVLLETILVYSSSQFNQEDSLSFHVSHLISDEEHLLYIFFICITTLIVIKIIVPILCYLSNEYSYTSLYFYVNVIVNHLFWSLILLPLLIYFFYIDYKVFNLFSISKKKNKLKTFTSIFCFNPKISNT